jgi:solute carrier family 35 protein E1
MISLGAGPVSFTHIVKALEPFFSALVSAILSQKWMPWQVYATLIPVVGGVGYACFNERSFSWLAFWTAMASNVSFALRAVVSKSLMTSSPNEPQQKYVETISSVNLFALVTWAAFFLSIPIAWIGEGSTYVQLWEKGVGLHHQRLMRELPSTAPPKSLRDAKTSLFWALISSGLFHYLNNEVMYMALDQVHPVTLAVGNTMKRVFIMVASVLVFRNPVSLQAAIGSTIGIFGVLLYSLTKQHYEKLEKMKQDVKN